jgi:chromosome segregation ATPase
MEQNILIETLEKRISIITQENNELKDEINNLKERNNKLKKEVKDLNDDLEILEEEKSDLQDDYDDLEKDNETLESEIDELRDSVSIFTPTNLHDERKIEIIKNVLNKYTLRELEEMFKDE